MDAVAVYYTAASISAEKLTPVLHVKCRYFLFYAAESQIAPLLCFLFMPQSFQEATQSANIIKKTSVRWKDSCARLGVMLMDFLYGAVRHPEIRISPVQRCWKSLLYALVTSKATFTTLHGEMSLMAWQNSHAL